ncbi:hypothetical protein VAB18032_05020 [Micromonospora maris AB-18-032]|uniref:Uncharacterized protein n=1 Tax=Micromonospora maris TaxID=1003110 RepID=A0A9X0I608_9ACTN|nr:hypothetical protein VAB18032_05020 [Micromonospora maris AB-18-032]KUJ47654.1 hypothetical protein ADL17_00530 [Micromonospora maris]
MRIDTTRQRTVMIGAPRMRPGDHRIRCGGSRHGRHAGTAGCPAETIGDGGRHVMEEAHA